MTYRDDLEAAHHRAEAAQRALEDARREMAEDAAELAEVKRELARARGELRWLRVRGLVPGGRRGIVAAVVVGLLVAGFVVLYTSRRPSPLQAVELPFPVEAGLAEATALARRSLPDAQLAALRATYVDASGRSHGMVQYDFVSPARGAGISNANPSCAIGVTVTRGYMSVGPPWTAVCSDLPLRLACPIAEVLARGQVDAGEAHLHISWRSPGADGGRPTWLVDREGSRFGAATRRVVDDCNVTPRAPRRAGRRRWR